MLIMYKRMEVNAIYEELLEFSIKNIILIPLIIIIIVYFIHVTSTHTLCTPFIDIKHGNPYTSVIVEQESEGKAVF